MTQEELASALNTGRSQVVKLERGDRRLTQEWMVRIASVLGIEPAELLPGYISTVSVPIISWIHVARKSGDNSVMKNIAESWIRADETSKTLFGLRVVGNAMSLEAPEGSFIIVDYTDKDLVNDRMYIFKYGPDFVGFKKYLDLDGPPRFEPRSHEPGHKSVYIDPHLGLEIIGRVVQIIRKV